MPDVEIPNPKVVSVEAVAWNVPMTAPYRSAQRITTTARNVLVRVVLDDERVGFGESAPATYVTGETQESVLARIQESAPRIEGAGFLSAQYYIEHIPTPGARGALEMAFYDAFTRTDSVSFRRLLGGEPMAFIGHQTDLSLPLLPPHEAKIRAADAARDGYRALKIKVGAPNMDEDLARVRAVAEAAPQATLRLDGNQGFLPEDAVRFINALSDLLPRIELLEQPTKAGDDDALLFVQKRISVPVFADEAVHNPEDASRLLSLGACKGVVLKLAKSGIVETFHIANAAIRADGLLMFGCMMETRLAISAALQIAAIYNEDTADLPPDERVRLDLDGHLLTNGDGMVSGGFTQQGDVLTFNPDTPGLGVDVVWPPPTP